MLNRKSRAGTYITIRCGAVINLPHKSLLKIPHGSPVRAWYEVSFVNSNAGLYSTSVSAVLYVMSCTLDQVIKALVCTMSIIYDVHINSSLPSAAYMRPWTGSTLIPIRACRLVGAKSLSEPMLNWTLKNKLQWNFYRNSCLFIQENAFENVVCQNGGLLFPAEMS